MLPTFSIFTLVVLGNLWIWKIFGFNPFVAILLIAATFALYKNSKYVFLVLFAVILFFQYRTTNIQNLTNLTNDQQRVQDMRLKAYPYWATRIGWWLEGRKESIAFFRIKQNFFENLDINQYFFASHPRERVGIVEFEKFPYILFPFFILGIFYLSKKLNIITLLLPCLILLLALISIIGNMNNLGPFSLFPFISIAISVGLTETDRRAKLLLHKSYQKALIAFAIVFVLVFLQIVSYAKY